MIFFMEDRGLIVSHFTLYGLGLCEVGFVLIMLTNYDIYRCLVLFI